MTRLLNDRHYLNLFLAVLFIFGIGCSLYFIYSVPADLRIADGYQPQFMKVYFVLGATFLLGALAIVSALQNRKEIIVFRDRTLEANEADTNDEAGKTTISLESVKTNIAKAENTKEVLNLGLHAICKQLDAGQGAVYLVAEADGKRKVEIQSGYSLSLSESKVISFEFGEGLIGQAALSGTTLYLDDVPQGYIKIISGLGSASPKYLLIVPLKQKEQVKGVLEIATFTNIIEDQRRFVEEAAVLIAEKIST